MDIALLKPSREGVTMQVRDPKTDQPMEGLTITLLHAASPKGKRFSREALDRRIKNNGISRISYTAKELEDEGIDLLVALTEAWTGFESGGKELPCTPENVRMVYSEVDWIFKQADKFSGDVSNFLQHSQVS